MEFSLDIIKRNDFYQTVLKRPMQITQIEAIKSQIAFQGNQMASEASESFRWAGAGTHEIRFMHFLGFFGLRYGNLSHLMRRGDPQRLLKVKARGILQPSFGKSLGKQVCRRENI